MSDMIREYIGRQAAWHNKGLVTGKYMTWAEMVSMTKCLNYDVIKAQLEYQGVKIDQWGTFRTDTGEYLGPVGEGYQVIHHSEGFETSDALMNSVDGAHYETAGVLGKGERVWGLANLGLDIHVGDDVQKGYLLFVTSYDATVSHTYRTCLERVVCRNTMDIAMSERNRAQFRVRHSKNAPAKLTAAKIALEGIKGDLMTMEQKLNFLAGRKVTREGVTSIFDRLFPVRTGVHGEPLNQTRRLNTLEDILKAYEFNDGDAFPEQRGTAYNLLNAFTNHADHSRSTHGGDEGRSESALFGSGNDLKKKAFEVIMETANGLPVMKTTTTFGVAAPAPVNGSYLDALLEANA